MSLKLAGKKVKFSDVDSEGKKIIIKGTVAKADDVILPIAVKTKGSEGEEIIEIKQVPLVVLDEDK